jgi:hypothetical protein
MKPKLNFFASILTFFLVTAFAEANFTLHIDAFNTDVVLDKDFKNGGPGLYCLKQNVTLNNDVTKIELKVGNAPNICFDIVGEPYRPVLARAWGNEKSTVRISKMLIESRVFEPKKTPEVPFLGSIELASNGQITSISETNLIPKNAISLFSPRGGENLNSYACSGAPIKLGNEGHTLGCLVNNAWGFPLVDGTKVWHSWGLHYLEFDEKGFGRSFHLGEPTYLAVVGSPVRYRFIGQTTVNQYGEVIDGTLDESPIDTGSPFIATVSGPVRFESNHTYVGVPNTVILFTFRTDQEGFLVYSTYDGSLATVGETFEDEFFLKENTDLRPCADIFLAGQPRPSNAEPGATMIGWNGFSGHAIGTRYFFDTRTGRYVSRIDEPVTYSKVATCRLVSHEKKAKIRL